MVIKIRDVRRWQWPRAKDFDFANPVETRSGVICQNTRLPPRNCLAARWTGKPISTASFRSFWPENRCRRPEP